MSSDFPVCNRTCPLSTALNELKFASSISSTDPSFEICGFVSTESEINLHDVRISITGKGGTEPIALERNGAFRFSTKVRDEYRVTVELPFAASLFVSHYGQLFPSTNSRSTCYIVPFRPNECDVRKIVITKGR